jgi:ABC-2 type transport system ATP-binding protein
MSQRLSIAAALLGDPHNLVLDEPVNGLDPEGVKWVRELCRFYASQGRAVLLSSHLMSEVALTADNLVIIGQGRILETTSVDRFVAEHSVHAIRVVTPEPDKLRKIFEGANQVQISEAARLSSDPERGAVLRITGAQLERTAQVFAQAQLVTYELIEERASLEDAYMMLTHSQVQYVTREVPGQAPVQYGVSSQALPPQALPPQGMAAAAQTQSDGSQPDGSTQLDTSSPAIVSQSVAPTPSASTRADAPQFDGNQPVAAPEQTQTPPQPQSETPQPEAQAQSQTSDSNQQPPEQTTTQGGAR